MKWLSALGALFTGKPDPLAPLREQPNAETWRKEIARLHAETVLDVLREGEATTSPYMNCIPGTYAGAVMEAYSRGWLKLVSIDHRSTKYVVTNEGRAALLLRTV